MKYTNWLDDWLENYIRPSSKIKTYTRYVEIVNQHIKPHLGEYDLETLSPIILQKYITQLLQNGNLKTGKGLAPNSVNSIISVMQGSLSMANRLGLCKTYTADKIQRPKSREKQVTCFTLAEQKKIEQAVLEHKKTTMFGILMIQAINSNLSADLNVTTSFDAACEQKWQLDKVYLTNMKSGGINHICIDDESEGQLLADGKYKTFSYTFTIEAKEFKAGEVYLYVHNSTLVSNTKYFVKNAVLNICFA